MNDQLVIISDPGDEVESIFSHAASIEASFGDFLMQLENSIYWSEPKDDFHE